MPAADPHAPVLGPPGEPCSGCRAPLAADQRYCLECGERRGPRRLDPLVHARWGAAGGAGGAGAGGTGAGSLAAAPGERPRGSRLAPLLPSPRVAGIATLLVLAFGIAAGTAAGPRAAGTLAAAAARQTIIVVQAAAPPAAPATTAMTPASSGETSSSEASSSDGGGTPGGGVSGGGSASTGSAGSVDSGSADSGSGDAGTGDAGTGDAGSGDAGSGDAGSGDAGSGGDSGSGDSGSGGSGSDSGSGGSGTGDSGTGDSGSGTSGSDTGSQPRIKHLWIVALTGHTMAEALATPSPMPYLAGTLRPKGLLLSGYKPALPGGLANLIAMISGQRPTAQQRGNCPTYTDVDLRARTGCVFAKDVQTLPAQLAAVGKTWRAYVEDVDATPPGADPSQPPNTCRHPAAGGPLEPVMARNPLLFFHSIVDTPDCAANTAGTSRLIPDSEDAESAPTLSLVIPNACHDGADAPCQQAASAGAAPSASGLPAADAWLKSQLDALLASKAYKDDGMIVVTFDTAPDFTKPLGALVISDAVDAGGTDDGDYRPANLLRTFEDLFALDPLARAKDVHPFAVTKPSR